ncbi:glycosyltransferase [Mesorhizobium amorphae]|uniref:Glycosyltransferase-like protein n=1 Tax=Mesorhizobium amorphae CCNWGS0123 TaxID=1082933 RepID=G6YKG5_9HYPH|nr:glycosyltransferase [Mesorhizobium amorphae]ANT50602.1 glycosyl transferase [Mesorhizobium amorphae CCNWGS0123]EHH03650.1 glycosyltransferase-like protein [Mesorhizobium amorphae CCNWGS0123]
MSSLVNILVIIEAEIATTHLIEQIMKACGEHGIGHRTQFLDRLQASDITADSIPLFVRCADPLVLSWTQALVDANRPYAYYIDDNFWRIVGHTPLAAYYRHPLVRASLKFAISHAKAVIANSVELGRFLSSFSNHVTVLPTFFDFSLIEGVKPSLTDEMRIGFAGSPSRVDDLDLISNLIGPTLERFPKTVFEFAGVLPKGVAVGERVRFFPHNGDYNAYIRFQAERNWAIGLAPLLDHEANRGKTDNKYREYGACRITGIYSDIPPYSDVVKHSVTGLLVNGAQLSWSEALTTLLEQPDKRATLANAAFADVKSRYDVSHVSHQWAGFFKQLAEHRSGDAKPLYQSSLKAKRFWRRFERIKLHLTIIYEEGGVPLVIQRIVRKLRRYGKA